MNANIHTHKHMEALRPCQCPDHYLRPHRSTGHTSRHTEWRPGEEEYVPAEQRAQPDELLTPAHLPYQTMTR